MDWGRGRTRSALWGGIALGIGVVLFALCSPSSVSCATNLIVLTHSAVTARGCAVYSVLAHVGVGLIVLGAVLLLGSFLLVIRGRRQVGTPEAVPPVAADPVRAVDDGSLEVSVAAPAPSVTQPKEPASSRWVDSDLPVTRPGPPAPRRTERVGPIAPGEDVGPTDSILLPPGWYGNPDNPGGQVQWWDGTKLVDRPT